MKRAHRCGAADAQVGTVHWDCGQASQSGPGPQEEGNAMFWYGPQLGGWGWLPGLSFLLFWALLAMIIFAIVRSFARSGQRPFGPRPGYPGPPGPYPPGPGPGPGAGPGQPTPPEQILAERFARGEIDEDEFHQRMTVLRAEAPPHPGPAGPGY
jgi:putative membrane protein